LGRVSYGEKMKQMLLKCYCGNTIKAYGNNVSCSVCGRSYYKAYAGGTKTITIYHGTKEIDWLTVASAAETVPLVIPEGTIIKSAKLYYYVSPSRASLALAFRIAISGEYVVTEMWDAGVSGARSNTLDVTGIFATPGSYSFKLEWYKADSILYGFGPVSFDTYVTLTIDYEGKEPWTPTYPEIENYMKWALILTGAGIVGFLGIRAIEALRKK
jgi:hypothetical protein